MPERHAFVIRTAAALGLLVAVAFTVDFSATLAQLASAAWPPLALAVLLVQAQIVLSAVRWRFTARRLGSPLPAGSAIAEYYLASLLNLLLPGGMTGDAVRALRTGRNGGPGGRGTDLGGAAAAVILERLAGQVAFFFVAACGIAFWPQLLGGDPPGGTLALLLVLPTVLLTLAIAVWIGRRTAPPKLAAWFAGLRPAMVRAWFADFAWLFQGVVSIAVALLYVAAFALCSAAIGAPLDLPAAAALIPLVLLTMLVPVSIGGFGLREGAAAALWPLAGYAASDGLAAALLYGLVSIAGALPGALVLFSGGAQRSSRA